jgi:hypothetical protein
MVRLRVAGSVHPIGRDALAKHPDRLRLPDRGTGEAGMVEQVGIALVAGTAAAFRTATPLATYARQKLVIVAGP